MLPQHQQSDEMVAKGIRQLFLQHGLAIIDSLLPPPSADSTSTTSITSGGGNEVEEDEGLMELETLDWVS